MTLFDSALAISTSCCLPTPMSVTRRFPAIRLRPTLAQQLFGALEGFLPPDDAVLGDFVAEEDVFRDRQKRHQGQFLVNDDDADFFGDP